MQLSIIHTIQQHHTTYTLYTIKFCRMGFHWPPFNSIKHLHLHVIFPESGINFIGRQIYRPGSFYFATVDEKKKQNESFVLLFW